MLPQLLLAFITLAIASAFSIGNRQLTALEAYEIMHNEEQFLHIPDLVIQQDMGVDMLQAFDEVMLEKGVEASITYLNALWARWALSLDLIADSERESRCIAVHNFLVDWFIRATNEEDFERMVTQELENFRQGDAASGLHQFNRELTLRFLGYDFSVGLHQIGNMPIPDVDVEDMVTTFISLVFFFVLGLVDSIFSIEGY